MYTVISENILTMTNKERCEAFTVDNNKIVFVGSIHDARQKFSKAKEYYFGNCTVMPSFIDAHGHFMGTAFSFSKLSLDSCCCPEDIAEKIEEYYRNNPSIKLIQCSDFNYSMLHFAITEKFFSALPSIPIIIENKSGHGGFFNIQSREMLGVEKNKIYLSEKEYTTAIKALPMPDMREIERFITLADKEYMKNGITVASESCLVPELFGIYKLATDKQLLNVNIVAHAQLDSYEKAKEYFPKSINNFSDGFKLVGAKIFIDGSIQDKTAWLSNPYVSGEMPSGQLSEKETEEAIEFCIQNQIQLQAHCNGDMAIESLLSTAEQFSEERISKLRFVAVHCQMINKQQLKRAKALGIIPSFFVSHVHEYGDVHLRRLGFERASKIDPLKYAEDIGCRYTFHRDSPVMSPNILDSVCDAVLRKTKSGIVLGKSQRISALSALKAVTADGAYKNFLEETTGTIEEGKNADFIVLSDNIENISAEKIRKVTVTLTVKNGKMNSSDR